MSAPRSVVRGWARNGRTLFRTLRSHTENKRKGQIKHTMKTHRKYIIQKLGRTPPNARFVANPGRQSSYTNKQNARIFATREEANANRCVENEIIIAVE